MAVLVEVVLSTAIVLKVPYTEIDWRAYMDEVGGVVLTSEDVVVRLEAVSFIRFIPSRILITFKKQLVILCAHSGKSVVV